MCAFEFRWRKDDIRGENEAVEKTWMYDDFAGKKGERNSVCCVENAIQTGLKMRVRKLVRVNVYRLYI